MDIKDLESIENKTGKEVITFKKKYNLVVSNQERNKMYLQKYDLNYFGTSWPLIMILVVNKNMYLLKKYLEVNNHQEIIETKTVKDYF
jgi:hypothetical protein